METTPEGASDRKALEARREGGGVLDTITTTVTDYIDAVKRRSERIEELEKADPEWRMKWSLKQALPDGVGEVMFPNLPDIEPSSASPTLQALDATTTTVGLAHAASTLATPGGGGPTMGPGGVAVLSEAEVVAVSGRGGLFVGSAALVGYAIHVMMSSGSKDGKDPEQPKNASELPETRPGTPEWRKAVKELGEPGKATNYRVGTLDDALKLLQEGRGKLEQQPTYATDKYKTGFEIHPNENTPDSNAPQNDLPHLKWIDWSGGKRAGSYGHIFYNPPKG